MIQVGNPRSRSASKNPYCRTDARCCEDMLSSCPNSLPTLFARLVIGLRHNVVDDSGNPCRLPFRYCRQTPRFCALFLTRPWLPLPLSGSQRTIDGSNMSESRVTGHHPHPGSNPKHFNIIGIGGRRTEGIPDGTAHGLPLCGGGRCKLHQTPSRPNHWNTCPHRNRSCWTAVFSHASPLDRFRYFNAVVTPVVCFSAAQRSKKVCEQDLCKVFRRLLRSVVWPPADMDYGMKSLIIGTKD